jgi:beta-N-acetylhexosaminidase
MTRLGVETLVSERPDLLADQRLGLVTNPSGVRRDLTPTVDILHGDDEWTLERLFAPEHGIRGSAQSGSGIDEPIDDRTGLPIESLREVPTGRATHRLDDLDAVVYDVQDIGCRFYTHISTLLHALETVAVADKQLLVLDRPNPIAPVGPTGNVAPPLNDGTEITYELPVTLGLTVGELAIYVNEEYDVNADLEVVTMSDWDRETWYDETGLPWVQPSPNMPTLTTATVYPGTCFFEATNLSEGRGTTKPFELVGAPWIDADQWSNQLDQLDLPGVGFRPAYFTPMFSKHERKDIEGVQVHVLDRDAIDPVQVGLTMLISAFATYDQCDWLGYNGGFFIDRLAGGEYLRKTVSEAKSDIDASEMVDSIEAYWKDEREAFIDRCESYLLY